MTPSAHWSNKLAGCWRSFWIGIAEKRRRCAGSIAASQALPPTSCLTNAPLSPGWNSSEWSEERRVRQSTATGSPPQEIELRGCEDLRACDGERFGKVDAISPDEGWVDIKKHQDAAEIHPEAVYSHTIIDTKVLAESLLRLAEHVAANGIQGDGSYQPARDLLLRAAPRLGGRSLRQSDESALDAALRVAPTLEGGILPIQGAARGREDLYGRANDL
jgi:hypothetical protein